MTIIIDAHPKPDKWVGFGRMKHKGFLGLKLGIVIVYIVKLPVVETIKFFNETICESESKPTHK